MVATLATGAYTASSTAITVGCHPHGRTQQPYTFLFGFFVVVGYYFISWDVGV
jgi:hypothetical protein